jgi:hypothetical protein
MQIEKCAGRQKGVVSSESVGRLEDCGSDDSGCLDVDFALIFQVIDFAD